MSPTETGAQPKDPRSCMYPRETRAEEEPILRWIRSDIMLQARVEKARAFSQQQGTSHALQGTVAAGEE